MIIKIEILIACYTLAYGLHHILRECSYSHDYKILDIRDGHMDTLESIGIPIMKPFG